MKRCRELSANKVAVLSTLHARADPYVVLMRAIEERRQIINLDRANVDVLAGVHVETAAERHGKRGIGLPSISERVIKTHAHVRDARHTFNEWRDSATAPVIPRTDHQIISLSSRTERASGSDIDITRVVVGAGKAGDGGDVSSNG